MDTQAELLDMAVMSRKRARVLGEADVACEVPPHARALHRDQREEQKAYRTGPRGHESLG